MMMIIVVCVLNNNLICFVGIGLLSVVVNLVCFIYVFDIIFIYELGIIEIKL